MDWLLAHLTGDFILQNDWMATGKKNSSWICLVHVCVYMLPFLLLDLSAVQLVLIALQHWVQDRTGLVNQYLKIAGKSGFAGPPFSPWSMIVVDNIFHLLWIRLCLAMG